MSKRISLLTGFVMLLVTLFITNCKDNGSSPVEVEMKKTGGVQFSLKKTAEVENVSTVSAILTRFGYASVKKDLAISGQTASGNVDDIPIGIWQLLVEAKDTNKTVLYRGNAIVEIKGNKLTYVSINLSAVSSVGNLAINVNWIQSDGIVWAKYPNNPMLINGAAGTWESKNVEAPFVLFDGTEYKMWYAGFDGTKLRIGLATSSDGINWTKYSGNPVLDTGSQGDWDQNNAFSPVVIYDGSKYKMWYAGSNDTNVRIGMATSSDGISWTKHSENPVLYDGGAGAWDDASIMTRAVIFDGENYKMWYSGDNGNLETQIGYAVSPDGVNWIKYSGNPVMSQTPGTWDSFSVRVPFVIYDGTEYKMWYDGSNKFTRHIGYASSPDGISWTKYSGNPVLLVGSSGTWDWKSIYYPAVLFDQNRYKMWYTGYNSDKYIIGYATSP